MKKLALIASVVMLGVLTAGAGTIGVAQFNDGGGTTDTQFFPASLQASFITLKNNDGVTNTYTIAYYTLTGTSRGPSGANTFTIGGNSARTWRPVQTDPNEGAGSLIPGATGTGGAGTASIAYSDTNPPSGMVRIFVGGAQSAYAWTLLP